MRRIFTGLIVLLGGLLCLTAGGVSAAPVDYGPVSAWACRPDKTPGCGGGLGAMRIDADGTRTPQPFIPAADPPIDCFYVYPTVSSDPTQFSDMTETDAVAGVVNSQAGRLLAHCRLYAPLYRQLTTTGLGAALRGDTEPDWSSPYVDVLAAWRWYMAHANHGRGVVIIGHSQGTILLQRLIAEQIDGTSDQARLVAAFLPGNPGLQVPNGAVVGGVFRHIPLCTAAAQTGCAYVWSSYLAGDPAAHHAFGRSRNGMVAACASPAAPGGGVGALKTYLRRPSFAPDGDPPWIAVDGQLTGTCVADAEGTVLRVTILPTRYAPLLHDAFGLLTIAPAWGLHRIDVDLLEGNIQDVLAAETRSWTGRR